MRKVRREIEGTSCYQPVEIAIHTQINRAGNDEPDLLALVRIGTLRAAAGRDYVNVGIEDAAFAPGNCPFQNDRRSAFCLA